jgi:8-oxo-dGTP diphosphatase
MPFTAELLGVPVTPLPQDAPPPRGREPFAPPFLAADPAPGAYRAVPVRAPQAHRRQRFAAYGLATDPAGRVLLAQIAGGYPGAGRWHLPGGGTDHGEQPTTGLLRELVEESGQLGRVVDLLAVSNLHRPAVLGPEGVPLDWHGVRAIYRVAVDVPIEATVTERPGGSTARARWFEIAELAGLPLTDVADAALRRSAPGTPAN